MEGGKQEFTSKGVRATINGNVPLFHALSPFFSAGIGRTGTLIAVQTALSRFNCGQEFSIFDIVKQLKEERSGMVQRKVPRCMKVDVTHYVQLRLCVCQMG